MNARRPTRCLSKKLAAKIVERDVLGFHAQVVQHLEHRRVHHRRSADVILNVLGGGMLTQVVFQQDLVNETLVPGPIILWEWFRKSNVELEVGEFLFDCPKVIHVEKFPHTPSTVPICHFPAGS